MLLVTGVANEDEMRRARATAPTTDCREKVDEIYKTFARLPPDRFPLLAAHAAEMVAGDGDERFRLRHRRCHRRHGRPSGQESRIVRRTRSGVSIWGRCPVAGSTSKRAPLIAVAYASP